MKCAGIRTFVLAFLLGGLGASGLRLHTSRPATPADSNLAVVKFDRVANARRVLIPYCSIGNGHKAAAKAIQAQLKLDVPDVETIILDVVEVETVHFWNGFNDTVTPPDSVLSMKDGFLDARANYPDAVSWLRNVSDGPTDPDDLPSSLSREWQHNAPWEMAHRMSFFERFVLRHRFDLIISTIDFPALSIARLRQFSNLTIPAVTVITDFHAHKVWIQNTDQYFVASSQVRDDLMEDHKIRPETITVSGIPISPKFNAITKEEARVALLDNGIKLPTVLGGRLILAMTVHEDVQKTVQVWGNLLEFIRKHPEHKVVAVAGRSEGLREAFLEAYQDVLTDGFTILGFTYQIPELMAVADIMVSKPGGLTTSEALASGLPFVVMQKWIMDVEKANAHYLLSHGAAVGASGPEDIQEIMERILSVEEGTDEAPVEVMQRTAESLGHPDSAAVVSKYVQDLFGVNKQIELAPGICCCGRVKNYWLPWTPDREKTMCMTMHGPTKEKEPVFDAEFSQLDCPFRWKFGHEAGCPTSCGEFRHFDRRPDQQCTNASN